MHDRKISEQLIRDINAEITRQECLKAMGRFQKTCGDMGNFDNLLVVIEELSEVAEAAQRGNPTDVNDELVQVIACCVQWLQRPAGEYKDEIAGGEALAMGLYAFGEAVRKMLDAHHAKGRAA